VRVKANTVGHREAARRLNTWLWLKFWVARNK
jgi:hypothetical protein